MRHLDTRKQRGMTYAPSRQKLSIWKQTFTIDQQIIRAYPHYVNIISCTVISMITEAPRQP